MSPVRVEMETGNRVFVPLELKPGEPAGLVMDHNQDQPCCYTVVCLSDDTGAEIYRQFMEPGPDTPDKMLTQVGSDRAELYARLDRQEELALKVTNFLMGSTNVVIKHYTTD